MGPTDALAAQLPDYPQGAAVNATGLWVSSSTDTSKTTACGQLTTGSGPYRFGPGSEGIDFDRDGDLWAVFEAGTQKFDKEGPFYPVVARWNTHTLASDSACGF